MISSIIWGLIMNLKNIIAFIGSLAFFSAILTVLIFILNYKYKTFLNRILKGKCSHIELHKILGFTTICLGTLHGFSMLIFFPQVLEKAQGILGVLLLFLFWILGSIPFITKKIPLNYKKQFFKIHRVLGVLIFLFILIHASI